VTIRADAPPHEPEPVVPEIDRRSLLKGVGAAGVTLLVAGTGVTSYRAYDNGVLDAGHGTPYDAWQEWRTDHGPLGAVAAAILAANPHNSQPWTFHVTDTSIDVFSDPSRALTKVDALLREHHVGLGCALENLVLAAVARGYQPTVVLTPNVANVAHVAQVRLTRGTTTPTSRLYHAIGKRHSNRGPYTSDAVSADALAALTSDGDQLPGVAVRWITAAAEKAALGALLIEAATAVVNDKPQSVEAFEWFRNNRDDIDRHRDGLTLDGQGLNNVTLAVAKLLPASSRTAGDKFWLTQTKTVHTATAAAYGVITVTDVDDVAQRLSGGRLLQRIHLAATAADLGLQHMNQITERIDRERSQNVPPTFAARYDAVVAEPGRTGLVTFRVGHPDRKGRLSPRRALTAVTR
jgi:hypothetical protein